MSQRMTRRTVLAAGTALLAAPGIAFAQQTVPQTTRQPVDEPLRRNASAFRTLHWRDHFDELGTGRIVADIDSRALHYWGPDGDSYDLFPSSVPMSEELTRRGHAEVVRKKVGPDWTPTASMRERDPSLPEYMPPGPGNPLGTHALYLSWPAYLIHGTHDTRKIGRPSSSGCIGLYNRHIQELFAKVEIGTKVLLL